ncbi:pyridoxamine 5'-phosphate oxidase family protein [Rhodobacteraceae bacterium KLH11]|nr:pyridoxamine 5'-phosphate oxidase family protein [Rhodobacteraceae bacterium KLH11]
MKHQITNPFHEGEQTAQRKAGIGDIARWASGFVRDYLPEQHRAFHTSLPFLVLSGADKTGRIWTTLVEGEDGFIRSPDPEHLTLRTKVDPDDPLADRLATGGDIGAIGIELATRRRNRFSGQIVPGAEDITIRMRQTFGNCPQYIHTRSWARVSQKTDAKANVSDQLSDPQITLIRQADTMFIGSGHQGKKSAASNGYDASHRGGTPGFVHVAQPDRLQIPDYSGNNFFNTIGNILANSKVGLLFVDFETGGLLHISGRAQIDWSPANTHDPDAWRMINVEIEKVVERPGAISLRWRKLDGQRRKLRLARREVESPGITSFYFEPADGHSLDRFQPGQHLPISLQIPGQTGLTERSYSLSGPARDSGQYRLSIKREDHGVMSRYLHDDLSEGRTVEAHPPAGDFVVPDGDGPLILASAGVGLTPMIAMLHALAGSDRPVWFVHGTRNGQQHALGREVATLVAEHENLRKRVYYSQPTSNDRAGEDFDAAGRMTATDLIALADSLNAHYMLCGPARFLADIQSGLEQQGIPPDRIHFETFGPSAPTP